MADQKEEEATSTWIMGDGRAAISHGDFQCIACGHQHIGGLGGICVGCPCPLAEPPTSAKEEG